MLKQSGSAVYILQRVAFNVRLFSVELCNVFRVSAGATHRPCAQNGGRARRLSSLFLDHRCGKGRVHRGIAACHLWAVCLGFPRYNIRAAILIGQLVEVLG